MLETFCALCEVYYPQAGRNFPDRTQTCEDCRRRLERDRLAVRSMYLRLMEHEQELADRRMRTDGSKPGTPKDPVAYLLPMAVTPGRSKKPSVSGSRERQLPINVTIVDLTAAAQIGAVEDPYGDQVGHLSVATVLNEWATGWHERYFPAESMPTPTALRLLDWLGGVRLEIVCERDAAIVDFARELISLRAALHCALGENAPKPVVMWGVPCRRCDTMSSLLLDLEDPDRYRECSAAQCGLLMTEQEYKCWLVDIVEQLRRDRAKAEDEESAVSEQDTSVASGSTV